VINEEKKVLETPLNRLICTLEALEGASGVGGVVRCIPATKQGLKIIVKYRR